MLVNPKFAVCPAPGCSNWEVACSTEKEKLAIEARHRTRYHPHSIEAVTGIVAEDPRHSSEREVIEEAIRVAARAKGGRVSANDVRRLLPAYVTPQLVGAVFQSLKAEGRLLPTGDEERSTDTKGRNTNKDCPVYVLREAS